jgi:hypothetical protein
MSLLLQQHLDGVVEWRHFCDVLFYFLCFYYSSWCYCLLLFMLCCYLWFLTIPLFPLHEDAHFTLAVLPPRTTQFVLPLLLWLMPFVHLMLTMLRLLKRLRL